MLESFGEMICSIFLVCDFQIIVNEVFFRSIVILASFFSQSSAILFWLCVTIYFRNLISPCTSFGVFDDFSGLGSVVFVSV